MNKGQNKKVRTILIAFTFSHRVTKTRSLQKAKLYKDHLDIILLMGQIASPDNQSSPVQLDNQNAFNWDQIQIVSRTIKLIGLQDHTSEKRPNP